MTPEGSALEAIHGFGPAFAGARIVSALPVGSLVAYVATAAEVEPRPIACVVVDESGRMVTAAADDGDRTVVRTYGPYTFLSEMPVWLEPRRRREAPPDAIVAFGFAQRPVVACAVETLSGRGTVRIEGTITDGVLLVAYAPGYTPGTLIVTGDIGFGDAELGTLALSF